jgi:hypothetical protein
VSLSATCLTAVPISADLSPGNVTDPDCHIKSGSYLIFRLSGPAPRHVAAFLAPAASQDFVMTGHGGVKVPSSW